MLYKIVHGLIDIPPADYLVQGNSRTSTCSTTDTSSDCFKYSFFRRTFPLWNRLPAATAEASSRRSYLHLHSYGDLSPSYSSFLHYRLVSSSQKSILEIQVSRTTLTFPTFLSILTYHLFLSFTFKSLYYNPPFFCLILTDAALACLECP